ncbi:MAG: hydantoinase/oxoprolinase family protein [Thermovirgaceae bacterium]
MADAPEKMIIGWDIGGVGSKCAAVTPDAGFVAAKSEPFEIWKGPQELGCVLKRLASCFTPSEASMGITMTAELSDCFSSKREGVRFVLEAFERTFPDTPMWCLSAGGKWVRLAEAVRVPDEFAATNWVAAAQEMARLLGDGVWVDVGSTTTDIIPFRNGISCALGRTDTDRLRFGELLYTGVIRSNPNTMARWVPLKGNWHRVADEYFTVMADCYLLLGEIKAEEYAIRPPDGGPVSVEGASRRLARLVCADPDMVFLDDLFLLAKYLRERQIERIVEALCQVSSRENVKPVVVATGIGKFLAETAAERLGFSTIDAGSVIPEDCRGQFPAWAAARGVLLSKGEDM